MGGGSRFPRKVFLRLDYQRWQRIMQRSTGTASGWEVSWSRVEVGAAPSCPNLDMSLSRQDRVDRDLGRRTGSLTFESTASWSSGEEDR